MSPSREYAKELTADQFAKIIVGDPKDAYVSKYLNEEFDRSGGNLQSRITEETNNGILRPRHILPRNFVSTTFQQVAGFNGDDTFPYYTIVEPFSLASAHVDWGIVLKRCRFVEPVKFAHCSFMGGITFSQCIFEKGATFDHIKSDLFRFEGMESLSNVKIDNSELASFWISQVVLPPTVTATSIGNFSCQPQVSRLK